MSHCVRNGGSFACHPTVCDHPNSTPTPINPAYLLYNEQQTPMMYHQTYPQSFPLHSHTQFQAEHATRQLPRPNSAFPPTASHPHTFTFAPPEQFPQHPHVPAHGNQLPPRTETPQDPNRRPASDLSPRKAPAKRRRKGPAASSTSANAVPTASLRRTQGPTLGSDRSAAAMHPAARSAPRFVSALNRSSKTASASAIKGASDVYWFLQPARSRDDREVDTSVERRKTRYSHEEAPFVSCRLCSYVGSLL